MIKRAPGNVRYLGQFGENILTRSFTARDPKRSLLPPSPRDQDDAPALEQERVRRKTIDDDALDRRALVLSQQNRLTSEKTDLGLCQGRNQSANVGDETSICLRPKLFSRARLLPFS